LVFSTKKWQKSRKTIESVVPDLPEAHLVPGSILPPGNVEKLPGAFGDPVLRISEEQRSHQLRVLLIYLCEGLERIVQQILQPGRPALRTLRPGRQVFVSQAVQFRGRHGILVVRAEVDALDPALATGGELKRYSPDLIVVTCFGHPISVT
jgi:hypothetical protein